MDLNTQNQFDENFNLNNQEVKKGDDGNYVVTLLLCYFLGMFGAHRIYNGRKVSGFIMLVMQILFIILAGTMFGVTGAKAVDGDATVGIAALLFTLFFVLCLITPIWAFVDLIIIFCGKFKNATGAYVKSSKSFLKTWVNYVVIGLMVMSLITNVIINKTISSFFDFESDVTVSEEEADKEDKDDKKGSSSKKNDSVEILKECVSDDSFSDIEVDDRDEFEEDLEEFFDDLDYDMNIMKESYIDVISFSKEDGDFEYEFSIAFDDEEETEISYCTYDVSYFDFSEGGHSMMLEMYDEDEINVYYSFEDGDTEYTVSGEYDIENEEYELVVYEEFDFDTEEDYDVEDDKFDVMDDLNEGVEKYFEEYEAVLG